MHPGFEPVDTTRARYPLGAARRSHLIETRWSLRVAGLPEGTNCRERFGGYCFDRWGSERVRPVAQSRRGICRYQNLRQRLAILGGDAVAGDEEPAGCLPNLAGSS